MNVYLSVDGEIEFLGQAWPPAEPGDEYIVDIPFGASGEALRLIYDLRTVDSLSQDGRIVRESIVLLSPGQTPDFLPGWEEARADDAP